MIQLEILAEKEVSNVHCFDSLVVSTGKIICEQNVLWIVVVDFKRTYIK